MPNGRGLDALTNFRAGQLPVGAWATAAAAEAVAEVAGGVVGRFLAPFTGQLAVPVGQATVAWAVRQFPMIANLLGPATADIVSIIAGKSAIDSLLGVRATVRRLLAGIPGVAPAVSIGQAPPTAPDRQPRLFVGDVARKASGVRL